MPPQIRRAINVPQDMWDEWFDWCEEHGFESRSQLIRVAVTEFMEQKRLWQK